MWLIDQEEEKDIVRSMDRGFEGIFEELWYNDCAYIDSIGTSEGQVFITMVYISFLDIG